MKDNTPIFILILLIIFLGFAYSPLRNAKPNNSGAFKSASSAAGTAGENSGYSSNKEVAEGIKNAEKDIEKLAENLNKAVSQNRRSPYYGKVSMSHISGLGNQDPSREYIRISTDLDRGETLKITGWYLKSEVTGYFAVIGKAALLPFPFTRTETEVVLQEKDKVILTKGFSPIGISFRTNKCTGYFEENRTFYPRLSLQCPRPIDEKLPQFSNVYDRNDECLDIIENIPRCTTKGSSFIRDLPDSVSSDCKTYITTRINYNYCVVAHFGDTDFPGNEYRLFLNKFGPLWRPEHDKINLHDENGLVVDSISY